MSWYEGYYSSELTVSRHISFFRNAAKSNDYNSLDQYAPRLRIAALERTITEFHGVELTEKLRFMVNATVQSEVHLFPDWHCPPSCGSCWKSPSTHASAPRAT